MLLLKVTWTTRSALCFNFHIRSTAADSIFQTLKAYVRNKNSFKFKRSFKTHLSQCSSSFYLQVRNQRSEIPSVSHGTRRPGFQFHLPFPIEVIAFQLNKLWLRNSQRHRAQSPLNLLAKIRIFRILFRNYLLLPYLQHKFLNIVSVFRCHLLASSTNHHQLIAPFLRPVARKPCLLSCPFLKASYQSLGVPILALSPQLSKQTLFPDCREP